MESWPRVRSIAVWIVVGSIGGASVARAEPAPPVPVREPTTSVGAGMMVSVERNVAGMYTLDLGRRLGPRYWVTGAAALGGASLIDPAGSGLDGSRAYEARAGVARLSCGTIGCTGFAASAGYHHQWMHFEDGLTDRMEWTEKRGLVFGDVRGLARLQIGRIAAIEAALGVRLHQAVFTEQTEGGFSAGIVGTIGVHALL